MALNIDRGYHIQLKRTKLDVDSERIQNYPLLFGEPVYLENDNLLTMGPHLEEGTTGTNIPDCPAVKLVSQNLQDPDDEEKFVNVAENGVHFKNRTEENIVDATDNAANNIYPKTKLSAVVDDNSLSLDELLLRKVSIDPNTQVAYPSLGYDDDGVFVHEFEPEISDSGLPSTLVNVVNKKVSIDDDSAIVTDIYMGVDLGGIYVKVPPEEAEDLSYVQAYIDARLADLINNRMDAVESNIFYLQELIKNISPYHRGAQPPADQNKFWIDTAAVTGGLKICLDKINNTWSHVPVAYT